MERKGTTIFPTRVFPKKVENAIGLLLLSVAAGMLAGCQGVSTGGSGQQKNGNLLLASQSLTFGNVSAGSSKTLSVSATNSGTAAVTISNASVSTKYFSLIAPSFPVQIAAGQSTTISVQFTPNAAGSFSATIAVTSDALNPSISLSLSGTGVSDGQLSLNPASESFGNVTVGSTQAMSETLTNSGGTSVTISQISATGAGFSLSGASAPLTLSAGQSTNFTVSFAPQSAGAVSGNIAITSDASNATLNESLSGTGTVSVGQLSVAPATLGLGNVIVGTSGTASGTLSASGTSVTVTAASANNSVFNVGGLSLPVTIAAGQSVPFTVTFSPATTGTAGATLTFSSNAQPSTSTETLSGTGTPQPTHSVSLSWSASTSSNILGYNVYRAVYGTACGGYTKLNSLLNTSTQYTDSSVADGSSYCYAATAVNSSNEESPYSNIASNVQIPPP